jgi:hypothetical protein
MSCKPWFTGLYQQTGKRFSDDGRDTRCDIPTDISHCGTQFADMKGAQKLRAHPFPF